MTLVLFRILLGSLAAAPADSAPKVTTRTVDFCGEVRPILSGPLLSVSWTRRSGTQSETASRRPEHRHLPSENRAIVPGKPDKCACIDWLTTSDDSEVMPPPKSGKRLTDKEMATHAGSGSSKGRRTREHWAYMKPVRPPLPAVSDPSWPRNAIDYFALARLDREGLRPSPAADQNTLLRRVALDLTGLPPSLEERSASPTTASRTRTSEPSIACWQSHRSASAGRRSGSTWRGTATRKATSTTLRARSGGGATPHRGAQRQRSLRPLHDRAAGGGSPAERHAVAGHRLGLPPQHDQQHRRGCEPRGVPPRLGRRPGEHHDAGLDGLQIACASATTTSTTRSQRSITSSSPSSTRPRTTTPRPRPRDRPRRPRGRVCRPEPPSGRRQGEARRRDAQGRSDARGVGADRRPHEAAQADRRPPRDRARQTKPRAAQHAGDPSSWPVAELGGAQQRDRRDSGQAQPHGRAG